MEVAHLGEARRCRAGRPRSRARRSRRARDAPRKARPRAPISTISASPSERWVNVENHRSDSISSPNRSTRTARSSVAGNTSSRPPDRDVPGPRPGRRARSGGDQVARRLVEVEQIALREREAVGPERRVGDLLRQGHRAHDHNGGLYQLPCRTSASWRNFQHAPRAARRALRSGGLRGAVAASGATRTRRRGSGSSARRVARATSLSPAARSRAARSSPATTIAGVVGSRSRSAASRYGRSDWETKRDPLVRRAWRPADRLRRGLEECEASTTESRSSAAALDRVARPADTVVAPRMSARRILVTDGETRAVVAVARGLAADGFDVTVAAGAPAWLAPASLSRSVSERLVVAGPLDRA